MRTLILGGTGRIGSTLLQTCVRRGIPHLGSYYRYPRADFEPLDACDADSVESLFTDYQPNAVVYAAPPGIRGAIDTVLNSMRRHGGLFVYYSGDGVLGECRVARREDEPLKPIGEWAEAQAADERAIRERLPENHLILRTSRVYGGDCRSEPTRTICKALAKGQTWTADAVRTSMPTYAPDLAEITLDLAKHNHTGTFHVVGPEKHTDFSFARMIAHVYDLDADLIEPLTEDGDSRPVQVNMDRFKISSLFGAKATRTMGEALREMRNDQHKLQPVRAARAAA